MWSSDRQAGKAAVEIGPAMHLADILNAKREQEKDANNDYDSETVHRLKERYV